MDNGYYIEYENMKGLTHQPVLNYLSILQYLFAPPSTKVNLTHLDVISLPDELHHILSTSSWTL